MQTKNVNFSQPLSCPQLLTHPCPNYWTTTTTTLTNYCLSLPTYCYHFFSVAPPTSLTLISSFYTRYNQMQQTKTLPNKWFPAPYLPWRQVQGFPITWRDSPRPAQGGCTLSASDALPEELSASESAKKSRNTHDKQITLTLFRQHRLQGDMFKLYHLKRRNHCQNLNC